MKGQRIDLSLNKKAWFRYIARMIDMTIGILFVGLAFGIILGIVDAFLKIHYEDTSQVVKFSLKTFIIIFYFFIEAGIISIYKTTPGKKLFGITLSDANGKELNYRISLKRDFTLWFKGLAFSIPFVSLFTLIYSYYGYTEKGTTSWDKTYNVTISYQPISTLRFIIGIIIFIITGIFNIYIIVH